MRNAPATRPTFPRLRALALALLPIALAVFGVLTSGDLHHHAGEATGGCAVCSVGHASAIVEDDTPATAPPAAPRDRVEIPHDPAFATGPLGSHSSRAPPAV